MEHYAAHELDVEVPHVQDALARLPDDREGFDEEVVNRGAVGDACGGDSIVFARSCSSVRACIWGSSALISITSGRNPLDLTLVLRADDLGEELTDHAIPEGDARAAATCTRNIYRLCHARLGIGKEAVAF